MASRVPPRAARGFRGFGALCAALLLLPAAPRAQLDLGTGQVPRDEVDAYLEPFYQVIAAGLAQGRFAPGRPGTGFEAGAQAGLVPLPDRDPFRATSLSVLPLFRLRGGARLAGAAAQARGLYWKDARLGTLSAWGGGIQYGFTPGRLPLRADLEAGWDRMSFSSEYTYRYRGPVLGLFDQDVPGDYRLVENVLGGGILVSGRLASWRPYAGAGWDWVSGRFAYLYVDPRDGKPRRIASSPSFAQPRALIGLAWRGLKTEAAWSGRLSLDLAWAYRSGPDP